eukprot:1861359-Rhodomonas_salina.2
MSGTDSGYAPSAHPPTALRTRYAMSGTDDGSAPSPAGVPLNRHQRWIPASLCMSGTDVGDPDSRVSMSMSGTDANVRTSRIIIALCSMWCIEATSGTCSSHLAAPPSSLFLRLPSHETVVPILQNLGYLSRVPKTTRVCNVVRG